MKFANKNSAIVLLVISAIIFTGLLSACAKSDVPAEAALPGANGEPVKSESPGQSELPEQPEVPAALFGFFGGTIKEVAPFYETDDKTERPGWYFVLTESPDGDEGTIAIHDKTFFATDAKLAEGATIVCFYDMSAPMPAINPPRYNADAVVIDLPAGQSVKLDRFDDNLTSSDNMLKLNISDATEIISPDGETFEGNLAGKKLVVYYGISTRSIPAQTTPDKIVVLPEASEN